MANPFRRKPIPALAIGYSTDLAGTIQGVNGEYTQSGAVNGAGQVGGGNVVGLMAGRQFIKIGTGGMRAPRKSE